jgi:hypothetical protein
MAPPHRSRDGPRCRLPSSSCALVHGCSTFASAPTIACAQTRSETSWTVGGMGRPGKSKTPWPAEPSSHAWGDRFHSSTVRPGRSSRPGRRYLLSARPNQSAHLRARPTRGFNSPRAPRIQRLRLARSGRDRNLRPAPARQTRGFRPPSPGPSRDGTKAQTSPTVSGNTSLFADTARGHKRCTVGTSKTSCDPPARAEA